MIVNVSSMFGVGGPPGPFGIPHYTAAKHGESAPSRDNRIWNNKCSGGWLDENGKIVLTNPK